MVHFYIALGKNITMIWPWNVEWKSYNYQGWCKLSVIYTLLEVGVIYLLLSVIQTKVGSQSRSLYQNIHVSI